MRNVSDLTPLFRGGSSNLILTPIKGDTSGKIWLRIQIQSEAAFPSRARCYHCVVSSYARSKEEDGIFWEEPSTFLQMYKWIYMEQEKHERKSFSCLSLFPIFLKIAFHEFLRFFFSFLSSYSVCTPLRARIFSFSFSFFKGRILSGIGKGGKPVYFQMFPIQMIFAVKNE